ncbi:MULTISPECIES: DUF6325 family protein [unclassified Streptomyces]|uniref:DUF6325 family protein n=1 Tax=unclassified Streptomyces TaxID=2593676 RepID=UPI00224E8721|nr:MULTISPECIES: DUF6325 family protein [unclassified Streptomyces]MCX5056365.1 DUF6325 family protein [Streptomyces sp. NBC_00452]MCX5287470.1 DUF6325 family protein [Streptomyces sp. NBC_00183]
MRNESDAFDDLGPIDYLVVEYPGKSPTGEALPYLVDLVDRGLIRILDMAFVRKAPDGSVAAVEMADLARDGNTNLAVFEGATSGLLGEADIEEAGRAIGPGSTAVIAMYENRWAAPFAQALRRGGARLVAAGRIPVQDVIAALDSAEAAAAGT